MPRSPALCLTWYRIPSTEFRITTTGPIYHRRRAGTASWHVASLSAGLCLSDAEATEMFFSGRSFFVADSYNSRVLFRPTGLIQNQTLYTRSNEPTKPGQRLIYRRIAKERRKITASSVVNNARTPILLKRKVIASHRPLQRAKTIGLYPFIARPTSAGKYRPEQVDDRTYSKFVQLHGRQFRSHQK